MNVLEVFLALAALRLACLLAGLVVMFVVRLNITWGR